MPDRRTSSTNLTLVSIPESLEALKVGEEIEGRYRIVGRSPQAGGVIVYEAEHINLGLRVALRLLDDQRGDAEARRDFEREAKTMTHLAHPRIVSCTDYGFHDGTPYLVMELLEGESLRDLLAAGPLPVGDAIGYALQILEALDHAHTKQIVHGDLCPENIWISARGIEAQLKVFGFGCTRQVNRRVDSLVGGGRLLAGNPTYVSPEQAVGAPIGASADLYTVGVLLFEMLTGRPPFEGDPLTVLRQHAIGVIPGLGERRRGLARQPALQDLVRMSLRKVPEERFRSAVAFAAALRDLPIHYRPFSHRPSLVLWDDAQVEDERDTRIDHEVPTRVDDPLEAKVGASVASSTVEPEVGAPSADASVNVEAILSPAAQSVAPPPMVPEVAREPSAPPPAASDPRPARISFDWVHETRDSVAALGSHAVVGARSLRKKTIAAVADTPSSWLIGVGAGAAALVVALAVLVAAIGEDEAAVESEPSRAGAIPAVELEHAADEGTHSAEPKAVRSEQKAAADGSNTLLEESAMPPAGPEPADVDAREMPEDPLRQALGKSLDSELTRRDLRVLSGYAREHPSDPRPHLIIAHTYVDRGLLRGAQTRYEWAYRSSSEARNDPRMLPDLLQMVGYLRTSRRASALIRIAYGAAAIDALDARLAEVEAVSFAGRRLRALRLKLAVQAD